MSETNKAIAKRLKNKGLQRLRWYCQMCEKQCKDENGFRNHCTTEGHLRNMEKFASNADNYIDQFSRDFEKAYLDVLSHHHHTKRVNANYVYNEMIQDKSHIHMTATRWDSLASFVKYLGTTGKCEVDETERGWFIRWIDPEEIAREAGRKRRSEEEGRQLERRTQLLMRSQKEIADTATPKTENIEYLVEAVQPEERVVVVAPLSKKLKTLGPSSIFSQEEDSTIDSAPAASTSPPLENNPVHPTWLMPNIIVRVLSSKVGTGLKNEKAVVLDVHDDSADLIMLKTGEDIPNVPSKRLETVIPKVGGKVMVLGLHPRRGLVGIVHTLNQEDCRAGVTFSSNEIAEFDFEEISKLFDEPSDE